MEVQISKARAKIKRSASSRIEILQHLERSKPERRPDLDYKRLSVTARLPLETLDPGRPQTRESCNSFTQQSTSETATMSPSEAPSLLDDQTEAVQTEPLDLAAEKPPPQSPQPEISQNSRLLDLPTELRIRILDNLLTHALPVSLLISTRTYLWGQGLPPDIASVASVCRQLYFEVQDIIWERLRFNLRASNGRGLSSSTCLGPTETCALLGRMRYVEICTPIQAIKCYPDQAPDAEVERRLKVCARVVEGGSELREVRFDCDSKAYVGEHDDGGVEMVARAFRDALVRARERGVKVRFVNAGARNGGVCVKVFREVGLL